MTIELTSFQQDVLARMRKKGLDFTASATEQHWKKGEPYYIDSRVNAKGIRRDFKKANQEALAAKKVAQ